MSELFNRDMQVHAGTTLIPARSETDDVSRPMLRMAFRIEQANKQDPNTAEVRFWNLSEKLRTLFQEKDLATIIEAGYVGNISQIFTGNLTYGSSERTGTDWVTIMQAGDGDKAYRTKRINESIKAGVKFKSVVQKALAELGLGNGNVIKKIEAGNFRGALEEFSSGVVLSGNAADVLARLTKTLGFEFQIRNGQPEIFKPSETTEDEPIGLNMESGLIGVPEIGEDGAIKARSLLQGGLYPARRVEIIARRTGEFGFEVNGFFKIQRSVHIGDTWGNDWYSDIEAVPL